MPKEDKGTGGKSSKTARVLSLLTDPNSAAPEREENGKQTKETKASAASETGKKQTGRKRKTSTPPAPAAHEEETQKQIRSALELELLGQQPEQPTLPELDNEAEEDVPEVEVIRQPEPEPEPEPPKAPEPKPERRTRRRRKAEPEPAPVAEPVSQEPEPTAQASPSSVETSSAVITLDDDGSRPYACLNVTQALVEEKTDKYVKLFGVCTCQRCRVDIIALALSNLPAKYVVVKKQDINPRLSMYESRYSSAVITQVMSACKKVMEHPHHER